MLKLKIFPLLLSIFILALLVRFLYFPDNIYFGYDQARDAFATQEIISGQFKIIGPPTTFQGLNHGVLYYYLYAPFYLIGDKDPAFTAAFLRIANAAAIFLIFLLASVVFNKYIGLIAALIFVFSFEQTQFALYLNHPSLAVISILIMFLGLALLVFKKNPKGIIIAALGLGLSIQFEFILTYLIVPFTAILTYYRKDIKFNTKYLFISFAIFILTISSFIISEIKFGFMSFQSLPNLLVGEGRSIANIFAGYLFGLDQMIRFNFTGSKQFNFLFIFLFFIFLKLLFSKVNKQMTFLGIWFFSLITIYIVSGGGNTDSQVVQYHPNVGASLSFVIFVSYLIYNLFLKSRVAAIFVIGLIIILNISMILKFNPMGSVGEINAQSFMLLSDEKKVLDFIYKDASGEDFAVKAITMPFYINTTFSYVFEWYGQKQYGYLPVWGGKNAEGYPGNLKVVDAQDKLPNKQYLIIEPTRGIPSRLIDEYLREESYFTDIAQEKKIGDFVVQVRTKK